MKLSQINISTCPFCKSSLDITENKNATYSKRFSANCSSLVESNDYMGPHYYIEYEQFANNEEKFVIDVYFKNFVLEMIQYSHFESYSSLITKISGTYTDQSIDLPIYDLNKYAYDKLETKLANILLIK